MENADRITVLRDGKTVKTFSGDETDSKEITMAMVGRDIIVGEDLPENVKGDVVLELKDVTAIGEMGQEALKSLSLQVRRGEILGIAGVAGNGQKELAEIIAGLRELASGEIRVHGENFTGKSTRQLIEAGVSLIPEDRLRTGLVGSLSIIENSILKNYRSQEMGRGFLINWSKVKKHAAELVDKFDVKTAGLNSPTKLMSGGNLQKLLLAREISNNPEVIVAVYPARGLDVGAIESVRNMLLQQRAQGKAVLLISEELEELFALSDRVAVMHEGEIMGILNRDKLDLEKVGMMMAGERKEEAYERSADR